MYHESTRCISILFYTNKHDKIKKNCVILENISLLYNAQKFRNLMEGNVIQINGGITIDVNVCVKNVMYVNPVIGVLLHIVAKMENV